jgi:hypothetical protein
VRVTQSNPVRALDGSRPTSLSASASVQGRPVALRPGRLDLRLGCARPYSFPPLALHTDAGGALLMDPNSFALAQVSAFPRVT